MEDLLRRYFMHHKKQEDPKGQCLFHVALDSVDNVLDLFGGGSLEILNPSRVSFDDTDKMYVFTSDYSVAARIKAPFTKESFPENSFTVICQMRCMTKSTSEKYLFSILIKTGSDFNKTTSCSLQILHASSGTSDVNKFADKVQFFSSRISPSFRTFTTDDESRTFAGHTPHLPSSWINIYDGYIYFGGAYEFKNTQITYKLKNLMIFNYILTDEEIIKIQEQLENKYKN